MRRTSCLACAALMVLQAAVAAEEGPLMPRVRADGEKARQLLSAALDASPSVRRLVDELQARDVIVFVTVRPPTVGCDGRYHASMRLAGVGHGHRFAVVWIDEWEARVSRIALLAHELQHVLELANAPWVKTQEQMRRLFSHIGLEHRPNHFETEAALDVQATARREAAASAAAVQPRRPAGE